MAIPAKVCVIGVGSHARSLVAAIINSPHYEVFGLIDWADSFDPLEKVLGKSVIGCAGFENLLSIKSMILDYNFIIAIGDNELRRKIYDLVKREGAKFISAISGTAHVDSFSSVDLGSFVGIGSIINTQVCVGENSIVNSGALLEHDVKVGANSHIGPKSVICGSSVIGSEVLIGAGSIVLPKLEIGAGVTIGAGSIVTSSILPSSAIYVGSPARRIN
jgi:sugar O-acyltransferase (sialic acid O-acetyltransferase NeuD family)